MPNSTLESKIIDRAVERLLRSTRPVTGSGDIELVGDGEASIEAAAGRDPWIKTEPAYSGGKLEIAWTFQGERLPVVVDIGSLEAKSGSAFVLDHKLDKPLGTIQRIKKTNNQIVADGPLTHLERDYVKNEIAAARRGFKHRPSITVYDPDPKNVRRVGEEESLLINDRHQEGPFFAVYKGRLRNIALVSTPGDYWSDESGSILAHSKGENNMSVDIEKNVNANAENQLPAATESKADAAPKTDVAASAGEQPVREKVVEGESRKADGAIIQGPAMIDHSVRLEKMYDKGDICASVYAQGLERGWTPQQALDAESKIGKLTNGVGGAPNVAGYPQANSEKTRPNREMIMATAYAMKHGELSQDDAKKYLNVSDDVVHEASSSKFERIKHSDLMAHVVDVADGGNRRYNEGVPRFSMSPEELFEACVDIQASVDSKHRIDPDDIRADADTGLSTIGLKYIDLMVNRAVMAQAYDTTPTTWRQIAKVANHKDFRKTTVHRVEMIGRYQRLGEIGAEHPHATYGESMTEAQVDSWGLMVAFSYKDIVNDEPGVFLGAARDLGTKAAEALDMECYAAILKDGPQLFTTGHGNLLTGGTSAFGFPGLKRGKAAFRKMKSPAGQKIHIRPEILLIPDTLEDTVLELLSMVTMDGSANGPKNLYRNYKVIATPWLTADNGLEIVTGSKTESLPGSDDAWYMLANPSRQPIVVGSFLHGKTTPTIKRGNLRFSLEDGIQYKGTMHFEFNTADYRGGVKANGA